MYGQAEKAMTNLLPSPDHNLSKFSPGGRSHQIGDAEGGLVSIYGVFECDCIVSGLHVWFYADDGLVRR